MKNRTDTVECTSPATVDLLIRERSRGKTLRQLGQMFNKSHESIRQLLAKYGSPQVMLLAEERVAANLECPVCWLVRLRKEGIIKPIRPGGRRLYSEEQVRQIPSLIAEKRKCEQCGKPRPPGSRRFCGECRQHKKIERNRARQRANPAGKAKGGKWAHKI